MTERITCKLPRLIFAVFALLTPLSAGAQIRLQVLEPGSRSYPIAIAALKSLDEHGGKDIATKFADIVSRDLTLSGFFKVLDRNAYIEKPETSGTTVEETNFDNWSAIGAAALVKGSFTLEGDNLVIEAKVFDVYQRKQLTGRRYRGSADLVRRMAHRFADEIMQQFTGERGPFDSRITFLSNREGRFKEVYVMSLDGGDMQQVTKNNTINVSPSWNPDARQLLYTSYKRGNPDLYLLDPLTARETRVSQKAGLNLGGEMSPDGSTIALSVENDGNSDVVLIDRSGDLLRRVTDSLAIEVSPTWSPDGHQLAFCSNRSGGPQIYVIGTDGGTPRRVTMTGDYNTSPAWSPKGDRIAYVGRWESGFNVFTVKTDGTDVRQITQSSGNCEDPSWSPDGRYLVYSSTRGGKRKLWISDAQGISQVQLTTGNGDDSSPAWSRWLD